VQPTRTVHFGSSSSDFHTFPFAMLSRSDSKEMTSSFPFFKTPRCQQPAMNKKQFFLSVFTMSKFYILTVESLLILKESLERFLCFSGSAKIGYLVTI
jgi:hypothetical protein